MSRRGRSRDRRAWVPLAAAVLGALAFVVLSVLVALQATQELDTAARDYFRPRDEWGPNQIRAGIVVDGLQPRNIVVLLAGVGIGAAVWQRSWRPAVYGASIAVAAGGLTLLAKILLERSDPHYQMTSLGGSFPSGHTVTVLVSIGGAMLILRERPRWWEWSGVVASGAVMGLSMLVQAAHWFTDVVGGLLLGLTVLAAATMAQPWRRAAASRTPAATEARRSA
jgi:membrane-associated phospholipid phosphatase